jgi:hypothetical protein
MRKIKTGNGKHNGISRFSLRATLLLSAERWPLRGWLDAGLKPRFISKATANTIATANATATTNANATATANAGILRCAQNDKQKSNGAMTAEKEERRDDGEKRRRRQAIRQEQTKATQIPFGDDNQKEKDNSNCNGNSKRIRNDLVVGGRFTPIHRKLRDGWGTWH